MILAALEARIAALPQLRLVRGAPDFVTAAETRPPALPAAYVLPLSESAGPNALGGAVAQQVSAETGIALALANVADPKGRAALADLAALRAAVRDALLGWVPEAGCSPLEFAGGGLLGFKDGVLWWQDVYATQFFIKG
jgi:hypothetical protein